MYRPFCHSLRIESCFYIIIFFCSRSYCGEIGDISFFAHNRLGFFYVFTCSGFLFHQYILSHGFVSVRPVTCLFTFSFDSKLDPRLSSHFSLPSLCSHCGIWLSVWITSTENNLYGTRDQPEFTIYVIFSAYKNLQLPNLDNFKGI